MPTNSSRHETVKMLVESYKLSDLYEKAINREKERFTLVKNIVEDYSVSSLFQQAVRYDLFKQLRLKLDENALSNITADMLNPKKSPFGKFILVQLLKKTEQNKIAQIIESTDENLIRVRREQAGDNSRIDIRVYTRNFSGENAIVDFELKVGHRSETININKEDKYQTDREWKDLLNFSEKSGIGNIVAYFITPDGVQAKNSNFISVARYELNQIICELLNNPTDKADKIDIDGICALRHFFKSNYVF